MRRDSARMEGDEPSALAPAWSGPRLSRWLGGLYALLVLVGAAALRLPGATVRGNELSFERCIFTAVNAATLTGFQQSVALDHYGALGQVVVMLLVAAGTLLSLIIGGMALNRALRLRFTDLEIVQATAFLYVFSLGIGTSLLLDPARGLAPSASQAASAFGNSGVFLGTLPSVTDWRTHAVLLPLMVLGGFGVPVILELKDLIFRRQPLSNHSRTVLALLAGVYVVGVIALAPWEQSGDGSLTAILATGSALSIGTRTCGLPLVSPATASRVTQWLLIAFMLIGAAPGGTAGGLKVTVLFHGWRGTRRALRRDPGHRVTGVAATWLCAYLVLIFATLLALLAAVPEMAADRLLMLSVSAVSNAGLAHEPVSITGAGLSVLSVAMLLGRAAPLLVLWWLASTTKDVDVAV